MYANFRAFGVFNGAVRGENSDAVGPARGNAGGKRHLSTALGDVTVEKSEYRRKFSKRVHHERTSEGLGAAAAVCAIFRAFGEFRFAVGGEESDTVGPG